MKLNSISIRNFRGLENITLPIKQTRPTVVTGPNGMGKSSVLNAFEFVWTGKNPTEQSHHQGLVRDEDVPCWVMIQTPAGQIRRTLSPHSLSIEGKKAKTLETAQTRLCTMVGADVDEIARALRPDLFVAAKDADQMAQLQDLIDLRVPADRVEKTVRELGEKQNLPAVEVYLASTGDWSSDLDGANKLLRSERKSRKKQRDEAQTRLAAMVKDEDQGKSPPFAEAPNSEDESWVFNELSDVNRRLGAAEQREQSRNAMVAAIEGREKALGEMTGKLTEDAEAALNQRLAETRAKIEGSPTLGELARKLAQLESDACPMCSREWEDLEKRQAQRQETQELLSTVNGLFEEQKKLRAQQDESDRYKAELAAIDRLKAKLAELGDPEDLSLLRERVAELTDNHNRLQEARAAAAQWEEWVRQKRSHSERLEKLEKMVETLEALVKLTDSKGLKAEYFKEQTAPLADKLSAILVNWDMGLMFSSDGRIMVHREELWRPLACCSKGEKTLVALAVQVWLSQKTGLRVLLMDDLEALDAENQDFLFESVQELLDAGEIDHALLAGVGLERHDLPEKEMECAA